MYILTNISITYVNLLNVSNNLLMFLACVIIKKHFFINRNQRPKNSVSTSESCEVSFFLEMIPKQFQ